MLPSKPENHTILVDDINYKHGCLLVAKQVFSVKSQIYMILCSYKDVQTIKIIIRSAKYLGQYIIGDINSTRQYQNILYFSYYLNVS